MPFCWFYHEAAHLLSVLYLLELDFKFDFPELTRLFNLDLFSIRFSSQRATWSGNLMLKNHHKDFPSDVFNIMTVLKASLYVGNTNIYVFVCLCFSAFFSLSVCRSVFLSVCLSVYVSVSVTPVVITIELFD